MPVWSEQERMIADSAADFFEAKGGTTRVREARDRGGQDRSRWQDAADQGWIGMLVSESASGLGLDLRDGLVLMREAARSLASEPLAAAIAAAQGLAALPCREILLEAMAGGRIVLPAWATLKSEGDLWSGESDALTGLGAADSVLLFDRGGDGAVMLVNREQGGVTMNAQPTLDGGDIGQVMLKGVNAEVIASGAPARRLARDTFDTRLMLEAAELCGLSDEVLRRTRAYLETRKQFGTALASFQAVQQRMASVYVQVAAAEALLFEAARAFEGPRQSFAAQAAFYRAGQAAHFASREAIQFHGAIGFTDELDIGFYLKRCLAITAARGGLEAIPAQLAN